MTWLIIGGTGQLSRALAAELTSRKIYFQAWGSNFLDIRSFNMTLELILALRPSVIINTAAWTDVDGAESNPEEAFAINFKGAFNLAFAAKAVGAVYLQVSTDYVFSGFSKRPWLETDLRNPSSIYGFSKAAGEEAVLNEYPEKSYIFRTAWLYSKWGKNFAKTMVRKALFENGEVEVVNDQFGQPTFAVDLAQQIISSIQIQIPYGIYHATNSGQATWFEFAREIFASCGGGTFADRVIGVDSNHYSRPAKRPIYSVLGHDAWALNNSKLPTIGVMRNWRVALSEAIPTIISEIKLKG